MTMHLSDGSTETAKTSLGYGRLRILHWKLVFVSLRINTGWGNRKRGSFLNKSRSDYNLKSVAKEYCSSTVTAEVTVMENIEGNLHWSSSPWSIQHPKKRQSLRVPPRLLPAIGPVLQVCFYYATSYLKSTKYFIRYINSCSEFRKCFNRLVSETCLPMSSSVFKSYTSDISFPSGKR